MRRLLFHANYMPFLILVSYLLSFVTILYTMMLQSIIDGNRIHHRIYFYERKDKLFRKSNNKFKNIRQITEY